MDITTYWNAVFSFCLKMTRNLHDAEDLTQETFISALKYLERFDGKNPRAWLFTIAHAKYVDARRKARRENTLTNVGHIKMDREVVVEREQDVPIAKEIKAAIAELDDRKREILRLIGDGMMMKDVAKALNLPLGTVHSTLNRTRKAVKRRLNIA